MSNKKKLPTFLAEPNWVMNDQQIAHYQPYLRNWLTVHEHIRELEASHSSLNVLRCLMVCEYERKGGARMDILVRLHGKFNKLRYELERVELGTFA